MKQHTASELIFKSDLSTRARIVFMYLSYRSNKENTCFPSIKTIARECGMAVSTVKRALGDLDCSGYIKKDPRYRDDNGQTSNLYTLVEENPVVSEVVVEIMPMEQKEVNESECPEAFNTGKLDAAAISEEAGTGNLEPKSIASHQCYFPISGPKIFDMGGGHLQLNTLTVRDPMLRASSAGFNPQSPLKRGEPPPGSFP